MISIVKYKKWDIEENIYPYSTLLQYERLESKNRSYWEVDFGTLGKRVLY